MKLKRLKINNFLSYEEVLYDFEDSVTPIVGVNLTDDNQGSNGTGKTSLSQAIYYAIVGSSLRSSQDKKLIRKGTDTAYVSLDIYCAFRKQLLTIERWIYQKSSSKLKISINNEPQGISTVNDGNRFILNWIAISPEDLRSYFIVCKEYYKSFYKSSNTERLALISRFINFDFVDKTKILIQEKINGLAETLKEKERVYNLSEGKILSYEQTLKELESYDFNEFKQEKIEEIKRKIEEESKNIESIENKKTNIQNTLISFKKEKEERQSTLSSIRVDLTKIPSVDQYKQDLNEINDEIISLKDSQTTKQNRETNMIKELTKVEKELKSIEIALSGIIECPKCHFRFLLSQESSLEEEEKRKVDKENERDVLKKRVTKIQKEIDEDESILSEVRSLKNEIINKIDEIENRHNLILSKIRRLEREVEESDSQILSAERQIERFDSQIQSISRYIQDYNNEIEKVKKMTNDDNIKLKDTTELKLKSEQAFQKDLKKVISNLTADIAIETEWIQNFKDFKMYLALEQIKNIQEIVNILLEKEDCDLRVVIEAYKKGARGNLKEEITPMVMRDDLESFWYYSGGERAKIEVATILAIQQMINLTNPYGGLEFLCIDEITEGLCQESLLSVVKAFNEYHFPIFLITHILNSEYLEDVKILKIVKENGISRIENN